MAMIAPNAPAPKAPSDAQSIATNASYLFAARIAAHLLRALYVVILARALGPELYGLLAYGQTWIGIFVSLTALGFGLVLAREAGRNPAQGRVQAAHMSGARTVLIMASAALCLGIGWAVNTDPTVRVLLSILTLALLGRAATVLAEDIFAAFEVPHLILRQEAIFRPTEIICGLFVLAAGGSVIAIAALLAAIQIVQGAYGLFLARRYVSVGSTALAWRPAVNLLGKGALAGGAGLLGTWLLQGPLVLYALITHDKAAIGHLALVMQALVLCCALPWAIGRAALPVLSRGAVRDDDSHSVYIQQMMRLAFVLASAFGLTGLVVGQPFMVSVFGASYMDAGGLLGPALWLLLPLTIATALNPLLMVRERYVTAGLCSLAGTLVMMISVSFAAVYLGPLGVIAGVGAGASVWAICLIYGVARHVGGTVYRAAVRPGIALAMAVAAYGFTNTLAAGPILSLTVVWMVLFVAYACVAMTTADYRALGAIAARLRSALADARR